MIQYSPALIDELQNSPIIIKKECESDMQTIFSKHLLKLLIESKFEKFHHFRNQMKFLKACYILTSKKSIKSHEPESGLFLTFDLGFSKLIKLMSTKMNLKILI